MMNKVRFMSIDKNSLYDLFNNIYIDRGEGSILFFAKDECAVLAKYISKTAPTVDAALVIHGRWGEWYPPKHMILTGEEVLYRCSVCDAKYSNKENMRYCPNCGAKMDLE